MQFDDIYHLTTEKRLSFHIILYRLDTNSTLYYNFVASSTKGKKGSSSQRCQRFNDIQDNTRQMQHLMCDVYEVMLLYAVVLKKLVGAPVFNRLCH